MCIRALIFFIFIITIFIIYIYEKHISYSSCINIPYFLFSNNCTGILLLLLLLLLLLQLLLPLLVLLLLLTTTVSTTPTTIIITTTSTATAAAVFGWSFFRIFVISVIEFIQWESFRAFPYSFSYMYVYKTLSCMYYFMHIVKVFVWRWVVPCSSQNKILKLEKSADPYLCYQPNSTDAQACLFLG